MSSFPNGISSMKLKVTTYEQVISSASLGSNSIRNSIQITNPYILSALESGVTINPSIVVTYSNTAFPSSNITFAGTPYDQLILLANGVTIKYVANPSDVPDSSAKFIQADPRGTGMEWFAVVKDGMKPVITNYAKGIISSSRNALNFDGVNDDVNIGIPTWTYSTEFRTTMTIECWFKTTDTNNQKEFPTLIARNQTGGNSSSSQFSIYMSPIGEIGFGLTNDSNSGVYNITSARYNDAQWHHVAGTYNSSTGTKIIYIDGIAVRTDTHPGFGLLSNNGTIKLVIGSDHYGVYNGGNNRQFRGSIADVRIWNVVRTPTEIFDNYAIQLNGDETGLLFYNKLDQGTAYGNNSGITTTTNNMLSDGNTGSLDNFALYGTTSNWVSGPPLPVILLDPSNNLIPLNNIVTTLMTDMSSMFNFDNDGMESRLVFNHPIDSWDTSNVTDMSSMFFSSEAFNQPLSSWDTSKVTNMSDMFNNASAFNQPLNSWNTSNVTIMNSMFGSAAAFNQPLNLWDTTKVVSMYAMFSHAHVFNQSLNSWNTTNVQNMDSMFIEAYAFNQPLYSWNTSKVEYMGGMFLSAIVFNQPLVSWDTQNVTNMSDMFNGATAFNQDISGWDVSDVSSYTGFRTGSALITDNTPPAFRV